MKRTDRLLAALAILALWPVLAMGQSSSLYTQPDAPPPAARHERGKADPDPDSANNPPLMESIASVSLMAVRKPTQHAFAVQDLITIVVREDTEVASTASLHTEKQDQITGELANMPRIALLQDFMKALGGPNPMTDPKLTLNYDNKFQGDGTANRSDTFTSQITARIVDVKPNGTLVLEARKYIKNDKETLNMVLTGTCRKQDVAADNTVLSTKIYDMHLEKQHTGDLHNVTKKGLLAKFFETVFNF